MITLFNVSDINFIANASDKDTFRFIPSEKISDKFNDREILKRIFTENIEVDPDPAPPTYPEIIQQLIDHNPQPETAADVAKILSLYNPDDLPEIIQTLINANAKNADDINSILKTYPYEVSSAIFDYKYLNWQKLGSGTITRDNEIYTFNNAGTQFSTFIPQLNGHKLIINSTVKLLDASKNQLFFAIYNNLSTTSTAYPTIYASYTQNLSSNNHHFYPYRRTTNNGSTTRGTLLNSYKTMEIVTGNTVKINYIIDTDGTIELLEYNEKGGYVQYVIDTSANLNLRNIRICASTSTTASYSSGLEIQKFQITYDDTVISQWNK